MIRKSKSDIRNFLLHLLLSLLGAIMIYPLVWMFFASFKTNDEIFNSVRLLPAEFNLDGYILGWKGNRQIGFNTFLINTLKLVVPTVIFTVISSPLVAYGFARFRFPFHRILFALMLSTLMLPNTVLVVPRYIMFRNFGWLDTYLPFTIPALLATAPFYTFMIYQFLRSLPVELDESAKIDGLGPIGILLRILLPLLKPAIFSAAVFQLIWTWNDFFNVLIFVPAALALLKSKVLTSESK
jgi:oligogalacturonide transport system permease protein